MERVCRGIYVFGHGLLSRSCVVTHLDSFVIPGILEMAILKIGLVSLFDLSMRGAQSWQRTPKSNMLNSSLDHLVLEYFLLYPIYRQALCKFFCYSSKCVLFSYMSISGGAVINWPAISISVWYFLLSVCNKWSGVSDSLKTSGMESYFLFKADFREYPLLIRLVFFKNPVMFVLEKYLRAMPFYCTTQWE